MAVQPTQPQPSASPKQKATIRMYRLGVGDCFLLSFPRPGQDDDFRILIDCGVHQSQPGRTQRMQETVEDLQKSLNGRKGKKFDVVVATHEHQDHLSGFPDIKKALGANCAAETWVAWTEKADDPFARSLKAKKDQALSALYGAHMRMQLAGAAEQQEQLGSLLGFFGDDAGTKLKSFAQALHPPSYHLNYP